MEHEVITDIHLYFDSVEHEAARLIGMACERSAQLLWQRWGLSAPEDCRVYVMTSWLRFFFQSAPWPYKAYLALTLPLVAPRARATWPHAGGWALHYGRRKVVGVKPPRLLKTANPSLGEQIFKQDRNLDEKAQTVTCHELVHAFTFHLKLPTWLHEGLATLAMEYYLGRSIVREDTLETLVSTAPALNSGGTERLRVENPQALLAMYARGYWLARYIEETQPDLLKELLSVRHHQKEIEEKVAAAYSKDQEIFWKEIDHELQSRFR